MCAIIGQIGGVLDKGQFEKARDVMEKRGPDGKGAFYDEENAVALGHRRLSILDLSTAAAQPMVSPDGRYQIVFNGEIFNFLELRKELPEYSFKTNSDTEVLLAAYAKWGPKCLDRLNGQFAFAIYDTKTGEIFCARDRLGILPFYYSLEGGAFRFASEIKALLALGVPAEANDRTIFEYLRYNAYDHSEETFFDGVKRLSPGHYAIWKNGKLEIRTYWDLAAMKVEEGKYEKISEGEAIGRFKELLESAIRLRFRSDVPVGLNLSSGLDSMSMLFFTNATIGKVHMFSAGLNDERYDEAGYLKKLLDAEQRRLLTTSQLIPEKVWPLAEKLNAIEDEPYGGLSTINYLNLYEETGMPGVTVLLEGQGVDEILGGYRYYQEGGADQDFSQDLTREGAADAIAPDFAAKFSGALRFPRPFRSGLLNLQYRDLRYTKLPRVLRFNDHINLAYSKELRPPYLDHRLVEFCFFLPAKFKIDGERRKVLLRDTMKGVVPEADRSRAKVFFGAFQTDWLRRYFKKEVYEIIESDSFRSRPYWDYNKVKERADRFFAGEGDNSFFIWQWINLEMWLRKFIDQK